MHSSKGKLATRTRLSPIKAQERAVGRFLRADDVASELLPGDLGMNRTADQLPQCMANSYSGVEKYMPTFFLSAWVCLDQKRNQFFLHTSVCVCHSSPVQVS